MSFVFSRAFFRALALILCTVSASSSQGAAALATATTYVNATVGTPVRVSSRFFGIYRCVKQVETGGPHSPTTGPCNPKPERWVVRFREDGHVIVTGAKFPTQSVRDRDAGILQWNSEGDPRLMITRPHGPDTVDSIGSIIDFKLNADNMKLVSTEVFQGVPTYVSTTYYKRISEAEASAILYP